MGTILDAYDKRKRRQITAGTFEDGVFTKTVKLIHYMRILQAYGIQSTVIDDLKLLGCHTIRLVKGKKFKDIPFEKWVKYSKVVDCGNGEQYFFKTGKL